MFEKLLENMMRIAEGASALKKEFLDSGKVKKGEWNRLYVADPSPTKKYLGWMLRQYTKKKAQIVDLERVIPLYYEAVEKDKIPAKDIDTYKSVEAVDDMLNKISDVETGSEKEMHAKEGAEDIQRDSNFTVVMPYTVDAARYYGKGTKWCISMESTNTHFITYARNGVAFYIIMPKIDLAVKEEDKSGRVDVTEIEPGEKFCCAVETNGNYSLWDEYDDEVGDGDIAPSYVTKHENKWDAFMLTFGKAGLDLDKIEPLDEYLEFYESIFDDLRDEFVTNTRDEINQALNKIISYSKDNAYDERHIVKFNFSDEETMRELISEAYDYLFDEVESEYIYGDSSTAGDTGYVDEDTLLAWLVEENYIEVVPFADDQSIEKLKKLLVAYRGDDKEPPVEEWIQTIMSIKELGVEEETLRNMSVRELLLYMKEIVDEYYDISYRPDVKGQKQFAFSGPQESIMQGMFEQAKAQQNIFEISIGKKLNLEAAFLMLDGTVIKTGEIHILPDPWIESDVDEIGFASPKGVFFTREEAAKEWGYNSSEELFKRKGYGPGLKRGRK